MQSCPIYIYPDCKAASRGCSTNILISLSWLCSRWTVWEGRGRRGEEEAQARRRITEPPSRSGFFYADNIHLKYMLRNGCMSCVSCVKCVGLGYCHYRTTEQVGCGNKMWMFEKQCEFEELNNSKMLWIRSWRIGLQFLRPNFTTKKIEARWVNVINIFNILSIVNNINI